MLGVKRTRIMSPNDQERETGKEPERLPLGGIAS